MATNDSTTPRPWRVAIGGGTDNALYLASKGAGYVPLATPYREDAFTAEEEASCIEARERCTAARANAALIVRAVNAHEAMRDALWLALACGVPGTTKDGRDVAEILSAALTLANEGGD